MYNVRRTLLSDSLIARFFCVLFFFCTVLYSTLTCGHFSLVSFKLAWTSTVFLLQSQRLEWLQSYSHPLVAKSKCNAQCCCFRLGTVPEMHSKLLFISLVKMHSFCCTCQHKSLVIATCICSLMPCMLTLSSVINVNSKNCQMHYTAGRWMVVWASGPTPGYNMTFVIVKLLVQPDAATVYQYTSVYTHTGKLRYRWCTRGQSTESEPAAGAGVKPVKCVE